MVKIFLAALFIVLCNLSSPTCTFASSRSVLDLDGPGWTVWMDQSAAWIDDTLYAPGETPPLATLPVNAPTGGWDAPRQLGTACSCPACVEELFANGNPYFQYHGVTWFVKTVSIPADWNGKSVQLDIARTRLRVEVYVDHRLAGYDLCMESPCSFDLTPYTTPGKDNEIAIRLTNPGGSRGYDDTVLTRWGNNRLPSGRDFAGIDTVTLTATDPVHVDNVFVMNRQPALANRIQIIPSVTNPTGKTLEAKFTAEIVPAAGGSPLHTEIWTGPIFAGGNGLPSPIFSVPSARVWSLESPNLYVCRLSVDAGQHSDLTKTRFGFRVFEVKPRADGKLCFYLNGKRFRDRSAIDFGYYAHSGMFATEGEVRRSVLAAKAIGFNGINLHRHIGEYRMLNAADNIGLAIYEEPGGLHALQGESIDPGTLADKVIQEKVRRMAIRDRNHPCLMIFNLSNEDNFWGDVREQAMRTIHLLDPAVMVCNASGHAAGGDIPGRMNFEHTQASGFDNYMRPYDDVIRNDYQDDHTVGSTPLFDEYVLRSHDRPTGSNLFYFGEVFCYTGPADWWLTANQSTEAAGSYDLDTYAPNHDELDKAFTDWNLAETGPSTIHSPADISRQAGLGLMYMDGRLAQRIMSRDNVDGFAINGWSSHSYVTPASCTPANDAWDSGICDEGRNLKGPSEDFAYWTRTTQVALFRQSSKYVKPGDTASFEMCLINEGRIPAGSYQVALSVTDGAGKVSDFAETRALTVIGGDTYAQPLGTVTVPIEPDWHAGYITLCAVVKNSSGKAVADGKEQVLQQNRPTWKADLAGINIAAVNWPAAQSALSDAGAVVVGADHADVIVAADLSGVGDPEVADLLARVQDGASLIVKFDPSSAAALYKANILSEPVTQWGGVQSFGTWGGWFANGWGYLDGFIGDQAVPSKSIIGTTSWEVPGDPAGFWPLATPGKKFVYGVYMERPDLSLPLPQQTLLVLLGGFPYGKGRILLDATYPVDANSPLNDMLFYNMISKWPREELKSLPASPPIFPKGKVARLTNRVGFLNQKRRVRIGGGFILVTAEPPHAKHS